MNTREKNNIKYVHHVSQRSGICQLKASVLRAPEFLLGQRGPPQWGCNKCQLTRLALSTSPHGSRLLKSMPVSGVPVGGSRIEASIVRYSTFNGRLWWITIIPSCIQGEQKCLVFSISWFIFCTVFYWMKYNVV